MTETAEPPADKPKGPPSFKALTSWLGGIGIVLGLVAGIVTQIDEIRDTALFKDIAALFVSRPQTVQGCLDEGPKSMLEISRCFSEHR